jgi:hypothetical protein
LDVQKVYQDALNLFEDVFYRSVGVFNVLQDVKNVFFEVTNLLWDVLKPSRWLVDISLFTAIIPCAMGLKVGES